MRDSLWVTELAAVSDGGGGRRVVVWSGHTTEVGADRMLASLAKPWSTQPHLLRDRWQWRTAPTGGRTPSFSSRAEALAAAAMIVYDRPGVGHLDGMVISSVPRLLPGLRISQGLVDVLVSPPGWAIGTQVGRPAETYDTIGADREPSHYRYLNLITALLFGRARGDRVAGATGTARADLLATLDQVCGPAGSAWSVSAGVLIRELASTGHFLNLSKLVGGDIAESPGV